MLVVYKCMRVPLFGQDWSCAHNFLFAYYIFYVLVLSRQSMLSSFDILETTVAEFLCHEFAEGVFLDTMGFEFSGPKIDLANKLPHEH